jgi:hypothetical protein
MDHRKKIITGVVAGVMAVVAIFGAFTYRSVFAQAATPTPAVPAQKQGQANQNGLPGRGEFGKGVRGGDALGVSDQNLAAALGITTDQLTAAYQSANAEMLKEAVSKGLITQAQADQLAQKDTSKPLRGLPYLKNGTASIDYDALLAKALNITTDKLSAARVQAQKTALDAAVKAGTMTLAQEDTILGSQALANDSKFQSAMKSSYEAAVKQAVTDGVITQAQADALLAQLAQNGGNLFGHGFGMGGPGGRGHGHGFGGTGPQGTPNSQQDNQSYPTPTDNSSTNGA